jgi:hypothetical protein
MLCRVFWPALAEPAVFGGCAGGVAKRPDGRGVQVVLPDGAIGLLKPKVVRFAKPTRWMQRQAQKLSHGWDKLLSIGIYPATVSPLARVRNCAVPAAEKTVAVCAIARAKAGWRIPCIR